MSQFKTQHKMSDTRRRDHHHLSIILLVVVGGSALIEGRHRIAKSDTPTPGCHLTPKIGGLCRAHIPSWSYVKSSGKCEKFIWGGCGGNANKFGSWTECENSCLGSKSQDESNSTQPQGSSSGDGKDAEYDCQAPAKPSECKHMMLPRRVYFDPKKGECQEVSSKFCVYSRNSFRDQVACQRACFNSKKLCALPPKVAGKCKPRIPMWSYVKSSGKCEEFKWGGCDGNGNLFQQQSQCEKTCVGPKKLIDWRD